MCYILDTKVKIWNTAPIFDSEKEDDDSIHKLLCTMTMHNGALFYFFLLLLFYLAHFLLVYRPFGPEIRGDAIYQPVIQCEKFWLLPSLGQAPELHDYSGSFLLPLNSSPLTLLHCAGAVLCVRWSNHDGRYLASGSDNDNLIIIWELDM